MMIIGMCGGTCSGKTTICNKLKQLLGDTVSVVSLDNYFISHPELSHSERMKINYDLPSCIDFEKVFNDITALKSGNSIIQPVFSFESLLNEEANTVTYPSNVIIIEGLHTLRNKSIFDLLDLKLFVDTEAEIRFSRRIVRDSTLHNRSLDFIIHQYFTYVKPMHDLYVEPQKKNADLIVSGSSINDKLLELIARMITAG